MSDVPRAARRRSPVATLLILALSILLHLALLRSVTGPGANESSVAQTPPAVIVSLHPAALPAPAVKPPPKPPPAKRRARPRRQAPRAEPVAPAPAETVLAEAPQAIADDPVPVDASPAAYAPSGLAADTPDTDQLTLPPPAASPAEPNIEPSPPLRAVAPPSALLRYSVQTRRRDGDYEGTGTIRFARDANSYSVQGEVKVMFFTLLSFESSGEIGEQGLAPVLYTEKRFRKASTNTHFQRERQMVSFSASTLSYPRSGLEQDRASIVWQLASLGLGDASQLASGTEIGIFVAGTRDGETWHLLVTGEEQLLAAGRPLRAVHVLRTPRPGSYEQRLDIWLAPDLHWYPVKLRFTEPNGDQLDLSLVDLPEALSGN